MTDTYTQFVNTSLGKTVAGKLGLPRPALLRRYKAGAPLTVGPVLLVADAASTADAATLGTALREWGLDVVE
jgi:3-oxoacyl-[acyl-carrier protein] reductase